jgi:hypothetical protein
VIENLTTQARDGALQRLGLQQRTTVRIEKFEPKFRSQSNFALAHLPDGQKIMVSNGADYVGEMHEIAIDSAIVFPDSTHLRARIPAKTRYDFQSLVEALIDSKLSFVHKDFNDYYELMVKVLADLLDINLSSDSKELTMLADSTLSSLKSIRSPLSRYLEATLIFNTLEEAGEMERFRESMDRIEAANRESRSAHLELYCTLCEIMYGKSDRVLTSDCLLAAGFDDTAEPQNSDYYEFY